MDIQAASTTEVFISDDIKLFAQLNKPVDQPNQSTHSDLPLQWKNYKQRNLRTRARGSVAEYQRRLDLLLPSTSNTEKPNSKSKKGSRPRIQLNQENKAVIASVRIKLKARLNNDDRKVSINLYQIKCFIKFLEKSKINFSSINHENIDRFIQKYRKVVVRGNYFKNFFREALKQVIVENNPAAFKEKQDFVNFKKLNDRINALPEDEGKFVLAFLKNSSTQVEILTDQEKETVLDFMDYARNLTGDKAVIFAKDCLDAAVYFNDVRQPKLPKSFLNFCNDHEYEPVFMFN